MNVGIVDSAMTATAKTLGAFSKWKPVRALGKQFDKDLGTALAWTTVGSIVAKDGVGCAMYVYQSKHNKEIPDDRRRFVTATDLTNGVLMIVAQIALYMGMRKFSEPIFNKVFKKSFNDETMRNIVSIVRKLQKSMGVDPSRKIEIIDKINKLRQNGLDIFKFVLDLAAATIVAKRIVVPFVAIPLASRLEKKMLADEMKAKGLTPAEDENKGDKSTPSMTGKVEEKVAKVEEGKNLDTGSTNLLSKYKN